MPDILIRMEMPKTCSQCPLCYDYMMCSLRDGRFSHMGESFDCCEMRLADCPLVELPEHGDLIDLSELQKFPIRLDHYDKEHGDEHFVYGIESLMEYAECLPVVVPAEKGETQ